MSTAQSSGRPGRTAKKLVALSAAAFVVAALAACATGPGDSDSTESPSNQVERVAIVAPENESDHGWNQQGLIGAEAAAKQLGIELDVNIDVGYDNTQTILTQVAEKGNQLVIAHASGFTTAAVRASADSGVPMLVSGGEASAVVPGQLGVVTFDVHQGSYLAGIAAAMTTETGTVGIVSSAENIDFFGYAGGFIQGVRSVDPNIQIVMAYIGAASYGDSAGGKQVAAQIIAAGADVILGMGDGATVGYIAAIEEASTPVKYIATIGQPGDLVKDPATVLATVEEDFTGAFVAAIEDVGNGTFAQQPYTLSVVNGGLTLVEGPAVTSEVSAAVAEARSAIEKGTLVVDPVQTKDAVAALLNQ